MIYRVSGKKLLRVGVQLAEEDVMDGIVVQPLSN